MVLKYFLSKSLKSIYVAHNSLSKSKLVIYEDTKGKTKYKLCKSTTDVVGTYNGNNYYIVTIQEFYNNSYHTSDNVRLIIDKKRSSKKIDIISIIDNLIKLFN